MITEEIMEEAKEEMTAEIIEEMPEEAVEEKEEEIQEKEMVKESTEEAPKKEIKTKVAKKKTKKPKIDKIMAKVDEQIKDSAKNLQIKNIIKLDAMTSEQASLESYDIPFYKGENIYMDQLQIQDIRQLYTEVNLNNYIANDPVVIMENKLRDIDIRKQLLIIELEALKNG